MELAKQAVKYLEATDPEVWLTYEEYARQCAADGAGVIKEGQWNHLIAAAGGRRLQDTCVVSQLYSNMWKSATQAEFEQSRGG